MHRSLSGLHNLSGSACASAVPTTGTNAVIAISRSRVSWRIAGVRDYGSRLIGRHPVSEMLLTPDRIIEGPTRVTLTVRPERVAFLVHQTDANIALAAVESACLTWGGLHQFLIPCNPGGRPDPVWASILEKHDPDVLLDLVGVEDGYRNEQTERWNRQVERWERPTETMQIVGAVVWAALRRWKRLRSANSRRVAINLHPLADQELALPLAFRLGHLDPRPMDTEQVIERSYRSGKMQSFIDLRQVAPGSLGDDELRRLSLDVPIDVIRNFDPTVASGVTDYFTLPGLTNIGLPSQEPPYWMGGENPEHEQRIEELYRRIVVVGSPGSVEDLCLAWNLRAQRSAPQFFPQWIRPEWIREHDALQSMYFALQWEPNLLGETRRTAPLHLVSATLSSEELRAVAPELGVPVEVHDRSVLGHFFTTGFRVGLNQTSVANFVHGTADVATPNYTEIGDWEYWERIGCTGEVAGYGPPRIGEHYIRWFGLPFVRIANDGYTGFINVPHMAPGSLWSYSTSRGWDIVASIAEEAGYSARMPEKAQHAIAVLKLLDGEVGLRLLASSRVYGLLEQMAESVKRRQAIQQGVRRGLERLDMATVLQQHGDAIVSAIWSNVVEGSQFDRQHYTLGKVKDALGDDVTQVQCKQLVEWLVERRILFQGYEVSCSNCGIGRWYSVNRLSDTQFCEGCGHSSRKPISTDVLPWRYRINETVAQAVDQGVLPHLLAVFRMSDWHRDQRAPLYGYLPGLQLSPLEPGGPPEIEIDLFAIKGGRIIIGECKRGGDRITENIVNRFAILGQRLNCSRIVYVTTQSFEQDAAELQRAVEVSRPASVEQWDRSALLDQTRHGGSQEAPDYLAQALRVLASVSRA